MAASWFGESFIRLMYQGDVYKRQGMLSTMWKRATEVIPFPVSGTAFWTAKALSKREDVYKRQDFGLDPKPPTAAAMVKPKRPYIRQFRDVYKRQVGQSPNRLGRSQ